MELIKKFINCCGVDNAKGEERNEVQSPLGLGNSPVMCKELRPPTQKNQKIIALPLKPQKEQKSLVFEDHQLPETNLQPESEENNGQKKLMMKPQSNRQDENQTNPFNALARTTSAQINQSRACFKTPMFNQSHEPMSLGPQPTNNQPGSQYNKTNSTRTKPQRQLTSVPTRLKSLSHKKTQNPVIKNSVFEFLEEKVRMNFYASGTQIKSRPSRIATALEAEKKNIDDAIADYDNEDYAENVKVRKVKAIKTRVFHYTRCCKGLVEKRARSLTPQSFHMSRKPLY